MKDLITEARELCERATPGLWQVKLHNEDYGQGYGEITNFVDMGGTLLKIGVADTAEKYTEYSTFSTFIARSRTLIPELCDALEKAEAHNAQLVRELSALARESVKRDVTLARLEAEVVSACNSVRWIPVTERLPEKKDWYECTVEVPGQQRYVMQLYYYPDKCKFVDNIRKNVVETYAVMSITGERLYDIGQDRTSGVIAWKPVAGAYMVGFVKTPLPAPPEKGAEHERD